MEVELGDLYLYKGGSLDPAKYPEETFEYYSIPAYDKGAPEVILGSKIGSSKKVFQPNDILLSRIVPHIRRCWVVGADSGYRKIGSGEWITFRSQNIEASYLRHYLMSNEFNVRFLKTIKGVGGSLMRADPKQVGRFKIPLPPLDQQKKIAAILDTADAYRQKTKALIEKYDELTQSLFLEMFGDFVQNPKGFKKGNLGDILNDKNSIKCGPFGSQLKIGEYVSKGVPVYGIDNVQVNKFITAKPKFITNDKYKELGAFRVKKNDLLISRTGTVGRTCLAPDNEKAVIGPNLLKVRVLNESLSPEFLSYSFNYSTSIIKQIKMFSPGATVAVYNTGNLKKLKILLPPISLQKQFAERVQAIENQKGKAEASLTQAEDLFNSLLQRAFKGELTST